MGGVEAGAPTIEAIRHYWDGHIHDVEITRHEVGTEGFFDDLDEYRFDKLRYLPGVVDFSGYAGKQLLELGCGVGTDLVRFARGGADVTGVDLAETAIELAHRNFELRGLAADLRVGNGEALELEDESFDVVYAHGVLQYTANPQKMIDEAWRVLRPGGELIGQLYNRKGWLLLISKLTKTELEHRQAPAYHLFTGKEFKRMLERFSRVRVYGERFPVKTRLHGGLKGFLYNTFFVGAFRIVPKALVRRWGWHLMASAIK